MNQLGEYDNEMMRIAREQLKMLRFLAFKELKRLIEENVRTDAQKIIFENSVGKSMRDLAALAGVSHVTVQGQWERWAGLGLVTESLSQKGRFERICSLKEVGLEPSVDGGTASTTFKP